jgi:hypothetical protein
MTDDLVKRLREMQDWSFAPCREAADHIEKLEEALREIGRTFLAEVKTRPEQWTSKQSLLLSHEQAEEAYEELGRRILIARKALEGKDD